SLGAPPPPAVRLPTPAATALAMASSPWSQPWGRIDRDSVTRPLTTLPASQGASGEALGGRHGGFQIGTVVDLGAGSSNIGLFLTLLPSHRSTWNHPNMMIPATPLTVSSVALPGNTCGGPYRFVKYARRSYVL